jgi:4-cresol dehydrogenase (hydroxylating)
MSIYPEGVSADEFTDLIAELHAALGEDAVVTDPAVLRTWRDPYSYRETDRFDASAVVSPTSTEQVQAVVRLANKYRVPLWTISQGRNNTYGGPAPRVRGSIIVSLRAMNRVLHVDDDLAYAVVQPGVRWFDLHDELNRRETGLWSSIPDLGWGSIIGNSLEYGVGYSPNGDHASQLCGLEIVLPDGEILRTGMGGLPGSETAHVYPHAFGPSLDGLFFQSNFGIVTSAGVWLLPRPERYTAGWVRFVGLEPLGPVVDVLRGLMLEGVITNLPMFSRGLEFDSDGVGRLSPGGDGWSVRFALYGREAFVEESWRIVADAIASVPGAELARRDFDGGDLEGPANHDERVQRGIPDMDLLDARMLPYGEDTAHLDFSPVNTGRGKDIVRLEQLIAELDAKLGRVSVGGILLLGRAALHFTTSFYDPRDQAQTDATFATYTAMVDELAAHGFAPYRTNLQSMDHVAGVFSQGANAQLRLAEKLKDAIDVNGVLAPGKSGIWPATRRPRSDD